MRRRGPRCRSGFALLAVLWTLAGAGALTMLMLLTARDSLDSARNRTSLVRATWRAEGCAERARAVVDDALAHGQDVGAIWRSLDSVVASTMPSDDCRVSLAPSGTTLDVNAIDGDALGRFVRALGASEREADSLAAALADWRDPDDTPRPAGAERSDYARLARVTPRNGDLASPKELLLVRGFDRVPGIDSLVSIGAGRVWLARAPLPVIAALPGLGRAAAQVIVSQRSESGAPPTLDAVMQSLDGDDQRQLASRLRELAPMLATEPDWWTLTSVALEGAPQVRASLELRLVRTGRRAAIVNRVGYP